LTKRNLRDAVEREQRRDIGAPVRTVERLKPRSDTRKHVVLSSDRVSAPAKSRGGISGGGDPAAVPINLAMEQALRAALGIQRVESTQSTAASKPHSAPKASNVVSNEPAQKHTTPLLKAPRPKPKKSKSPKAKNFSAKVTKNGKRKKTKSPPAVFATSSIKVIPEATAEVRRLGEARNASARLAFNARQQAAASAANRTVFSFHDLKVRWQHAFFYLLRFEDEDPDSPDIAAARERLLAIEAEWARRASMAPNHPDYFPWPTTDAPNGGGDVKAGDWQEIGMLSYLGYHVGVTSALSTAQRRRLLIHVFNMRLPPLNGVAYMRSWGTPETGPRLKKIAEAIAAFARNAKRRRNPRLAEAIRQWEDDLMYLRRVLYIGRFDGFTWPTI